MAKKTKEELSKKPKPALKTKAEVKKEMDPREIERQKEKERWNAEQRKRDFMYLKDNLLMKARYRRHDLNMLAKSLALWGLAGSLAVLFFVSSQMRYILDIHYIYITWVCFALSLVFIYCSASSEEKDAEEMFRIAEEKEAKNEDFQKVYDSKYAKNIKTYSRMAYLFLIIGAGFFIVFFSINMPKENAVSVNRNQMVGHQMSKHDMFRMMKHKMMKKGCFEGKERGKLFKDKGPRKEGVKKDMPPRDKKPDGKRRPSKAEK